MDQLSFNAFETPQPDHGIDDLVKRGAIFYISTSGGKDSQAMYIDLAGRIPHGQIVLVHADLGEVEWTGVIDHIEETTSHPLTVVKAIFADGTPKDLLAMVERRASTRPDSPPWPSSAARYCTSDLKRGPIEKFIRSDLKKRGKALAVNCTGIRAEESHARAKKIPFKKNTRLSVAGREVYDWMPIFNWSTKQVFQRIAAAGQTPHAAYAENERLSCVFCIFGSANDLQHGAKHRPELYRKYIELEERTGYTMFHSKSLADLVFIPIKVKAA